MVADTGFMHPDNLELQIHHVAFSYQISQSYLWSDGDVSAWRKFAQVDALVADFIFLFA